MSFCFTSFHLQSPSEANGVVQRPYSRHVNCSSEGKTHRITRKILCAIYYTERDAYIFIHIFLNLHLKLQTSLGHNNNNIFSFSTFYKQCLLLTALLLLIGAVLVCLFARTVISHGFILSLAFVATECVHEWGISKLIHERVPFHT